MMSVAGVGIGMGTLLLIPVLESLFAVTALSGIQYLQILGLAFAPTLLIQLGRVIRGK